MKRLAAVWRERRILTDLQAQEADHNIDAAVDDYHHHMDRRIQQNPPPVDEPEANSDSGDAMSHQSFSEDAPSADSVESAESLFGDSEEENRDEDIDHQRQQLLDTLTQEMAAVDSEKQLMSTCREKLSRLPPWVTSTAEFQTKLPVLAEDTNHTSDVLYRAMEPVMELESHVNALGEKRLRLRAALEGIRQWREQCSESVAAALKVGTEGECEEDVRRDAGPAGDVCCGATGNSADAEEAATASDGEFEHEHACDGDYSQHAETGGGGGEKEEGTGGGAEEEGEGHSRQHQQGDDSHKCGGSCRKNVEREGAV